MPSVAAIMGFCMRLQEQNWYNNSNTNDDNVNIDKKKMTITDRRMKSPTPIPSLPPLSPGAFTLPPHLCDI